MNENLLAISLLKYVKSANESVAKKMVKDSDYMKGMCDGIESVCRDLQKVIDILSEKK